VHSSLIEEISDDVKKHLNSAQKLYEEKLHCESELLSATIEMLSRNPHLQGAWLAKDRNRLLKLTSRLLADLRNNYKITHLYFHDSDRVNFLRVHKPEAYGDIVNRFTLQQAEESGRISSGVELGPFGTFVLRVVYPWRINNQLVGYIEMGEEIDHIISRLQDVLGGELIVSIYKKFLKREEWEKGMAMLGRQGRWNQVEGTVIISQTLEEVPQVIGNLLTQGHHEYMQMTPDLELSLGNHLYRIGFIPLLDVAENEVGDIVILYDVSEQVVASRNFNLMAGITCAVVGVVLFVSFSTILGLGRVDEQLKSSQLKLVKARDELEVKVKERTAELAEANNELLVEINERKETQQALQRKHQTQSVFHSMLNISMEPYNLEEMLDHILDCIVSISWLALQSKGAIFLVEDDPDELVMKSHHDISEELLSLCARFPFGKCLCGRAASTKEIQYASSLDDRHETRYEGISPHGHYCVPILSSGRVLGVLNLYTEEGHVRHEEEEDFLRAVANMLAGIIERKRAEEELKSAYQSTRNILEKSPHAIYVVDNKGNIDYVNPAMVKISGTESEQFKELNVFDLPTYRELGISQKIKAGLKGKYFKMESVNYTSYYGHKTTIRNFIGIPLKEEGERKLLMIIEDITERKQAERELADHREHLEELVRERTAELKNTNKQLRQEITVRKRAEQALRESEGKLRSIFTNMQDVFYRTDIEGRVVWLSPSAAEMLGYESLEELMGHKLVEFYKNPEKREAFLKELSEKGQVTDYEVELKRRDGGTVVVSTNSNIYKDKNGEVAGVEGSCRDISGRKETEKKLRAYQERLRSLASELSLTEERERRRIATDIHDHIGQSLAISKIKLGILQKSAATVGLAKPLKEIYQLLTETIQYTRTLTFELSPPMLYELGFEAAVEWLTEQIYKQHGISSSFEGDRSSKPLNDEVRIFLFQAVRELLVNIAKHGHARNAKVSVWREDNSIWINVKDDGIGFDTSKISTYLSESGGFGLFNIRERLDYLGGRLEIKSKPGQGTQVTLVAPLKRDKDITRNVISKDYTI
jgi:PAS domain S-box-containing protein